MQRNIDTCPEPDLGSFFAIDYPSPARIMLASINLNSGSHKKGRDPLLCMNYFACKKSSLS